MYLLLNFIFIKVWVFNAIISGCQAQFLVQIDCRAEQWVIGNLQE